MWIPGACTTLQAKDPDEIVFVYIHGFGERRDTLPFEREMRDFLQPLSINATIFTYRWDKLKISLPKVMSQWKQAKKTAMEAAEPFMNELVTELETAGVPYVVVAYSLGALVFVESLKYCDLQLQHLAGVYFLGAALPYQVMIDAASLPPGMKITNFHSRHFDEILKITYRFAEGTKAGGEVGFADTTIFDNYRTVCTHIHKGGPFPHDYSSLAPAIGFVSLFRQNIFVNGPPAKTSFAWRTATGSVHWNDVIRFHRGWETILIQQNANTSLYRVVSVNENQPRRRKAWGKNLHSVLEELGLFHSSHQLR